MILENDDIKNIIENPFNKNVIKVWQKQHKDYDLFANGGDVTRKLEKIKNFENIYQKRLRDKVARSTKDLVAYLLKPLDKVFTARGKNLDVDIDNQRIKEDVLKSINRLPEGISLTQWMQAYWKDAFVTDPNGVILIETDDEGNSYPAYKSILTLHDFKKKWNKFEYLIFEHDTVKMMLKEKNNLQDLVEQKKKVYRVIDDEKDGLYYIDNNQLKEYVPEDSDEAFQSVITHNYGFVPALNPSTEYDKHTGGKRSILFKIDEMLEEFLRDSSIHSIYKFLHGFPVRWQYKQKCTTCGGTGKIKNVNYDPNDPKSESKIQCPTCKGTTIKVTSDVSDGINLPIPKEGQPKLAPDLAGFIQPALETWDKQLETMDRMKSDMHFSLWGTVIDEEKSNTATGRFIDAQPVNDALEYISTSGEIIEKEIITYIAKIKYKDMYKNENTICKWGRRYMIETPDALLEKYQEAKDKQSPISTLDHLYKQYLITEYNNDLVLMEQKLKEFALEPYPHYSLDDLYQKVSQEQLQRKVLFSDWNKDADFSNDIEVLKTEFETFVNQNLIIDETGTTDQSNLQEGEGDESRAA